MDIEAGRDATVRSSGRRGAVEAISNFMIIGDDAFRQKERV
ncbi:MAG: hypothetical protein ABEL04_04680 [Salinibacter sp.]